MARSSKLLRWAHLAVGVLALLAFIATGQVMDKKYDHLEGMDDAPRMLHRSAHIYILFSGGLNLLLGLYVRSFQTTGARVMQTLGSVALLAAPVLLTLAFLYEPWLQDLERPYVRPAIYGVLYGLLLHLGARLADGLRRVSS